MDRIHLEPEIARASASQIRRGAEDMQQAADALRGTIRGLNPRWISPHADRFQSQALEVQRRLNTLTEEMVQLALEMQREIEQWEAMAAELGTDFYILSPANSYAKSFISGFFIDPVIGIFIGGAYIWSQFDRVNASNENAMLNDIKKIVGDSQLGQELLDQMKEKGVKVTFTPDSKTGSYYSDGSIYINPNYSKEEAANTWIHEMTHATQTPVDASQFSRQDYIDQCLQNEADAVINSWLYQKEKGWYTDAASQGSDENKFFAFYNSILEALKKSNPELSLEEMRARARDAGRQMLINDYYKAGKYVTSTTGQSYVDYYGEFWDLNHPGDLDIGSDLA